MWRIKIKFSVGSIFDHGDLIAHVEQHSGDGSFLSQTERTAARIAKVTHQIDRFYFRTFTGGIEFAQKLGQAIGLDGTIALARNANRPKTQASEHFQTDEIARLFDQDDVPRIAERLHCKVERLLRAVADKHSSRIESLGAFPRLGRQILTGKFAQATAALVLSVLQRLIGQPALRQLGSETTDQAPRQRYIIGKPGGQREQVRIGQRTRH